MVYGSWFIGKLDFPFLDHELRTLDPEPLTLNREPGHEPGSLGNILDPLRDLH
jgi:hypothetical protein